jgi:putative methyltransferase (TIGR04325 family)
MKQILIDLYYRYRKGWGWFGDFPNWALANSTCGGYNSTEIFEKVKASSILVRDGKAAFERDSVAFYEPETNEELIKWFENIVSRNEIEGCNPKTSGVIRVLDFGGALGSTYFQHREILKQFPNLIWCVVEQGDFVKIGQSEFENEVLKFEYSIREAVEKYQPNAVLVSGVLMYIEKPYDILADIFKSEIPHIMIDRTPFIPSEEDRLTVQIVPPKIYKASYPCWIFSEKKFLNFTEKHVRFVKEFPALDKINILNCQYKGMIFENKI